MCGGLFGLEVVQVEAGLMMGYLVGRVGAGYLEVGRGWLF